jgi:signal transduction histidine kinase
MNKMVKLSDNELLEELRIRMKNNLEALEELKSRTEELKLVNKKLEESEALKSHFISNITNEIINPFTSILGLSKAILSVEKENWKKVLSMVALIHSEAFALDFQLKNIFAAAKIEAGDIYPETGRVEINGLIDSLVSSFRLEAKKKNISFKMVSELEHSGENEFYFKTDAEKLRLILSNLLCNSVKYSNRDGVIKIHVWQLEAELFVSVQDEGTGISEDNQHQIFDRFSRIDSSITSVNRGHGLGLSINKALLDILGGEISLQSELGSGAIFTIRIPEATQDAFMTAFDGNEIFFDDKQVF